tara:strand:- start:434 stop:1348 length:915 start_codon:yes stop_codon:yes gene_type:complete
MNLEEALQKSIEDKVLKTTKSYFDRLISENHTISKRLQWTEDKLNETLIKLSSKNNDFKDGELSGNKIAGGTIKNFSSTGIKDSAESVRLTVLNDRIVAEKNFEVKGTIQVKELIYSKASCDDLDVKNSVRIDGHEVLWKERLGNIVTKSQLQELGVLKELNVANTLTVYKNKVGVNTLEPVGVFGVADKGIEISIDVKGDSGFVGTANSDPFAIGSGGEPTLYVSHDNKIGIKIKRPKADLDVAGYIRYQGQTQQYLDSMPTAGTWAQGDIVWNTRPERGTVLGWVCVKSGAPGTWRPFVSID